MMAAPVSHGPLKALVVCDGKGPSATQMISFEQPFRNARDEAEIVFEGHHDDAAEIQARFASHDPAVLVLSRYTSPLGLEWVRLARDRGIPIIFHLDDDLLAVPESLGAAKFKAYNSPERIQALRQNIEASDLFYLSTPQLKARYEEHGIATPMIAGDIYCSVEPSDIGALAGPATMPVIGYMGTGGHSADLGLVLPAICSLMDQLPSLNFELFGTIKMPGELERFGERVRHLPPIADYANFIPHMRSLGWWAGLAPLEDNAFNRCKADTKWVEYSLAGMAVVASDIVVYHRACAEGAGLLAGDTESWRNAMLKLLVEPQTRSSIISTAQRKLSDRYTTAQLRRQVLDIFGQAFDLRRPGAAIKSLPAPIPSPPSRDGSPRSAH